MYRYTFHANAEAEPFMTVPAEDVRRVAAEVAQRNVSYPSVWERLRRTGKVYIAGRKSAGGRGFVIRRAEVRRDTESHCHCGAEYHGCDHCPACGCEQYETINVRDCGHVHA